MLITQLDIVKSCKVVAFGLNDMFSALSKEETLELQRLSLKYIQTFEKYKNELINDTIKEVESL